MKEEKETFTFWIHTKEAEIGRSRSLTHQEKKYIKYSNWIRLMQLAGYLFLLVFAIAGTFTVLILLSSLIEVKDYTPLVKNMVRIGPALIITSFIVFLLRKKIPWKISLWLSTKNLEAFELTGALGVEIRKTALSPNTWMLNKTSFLMPEHWQKYIPILYPDEKKLPTVTLWAVKRKEATNKVYSYISNNPNTSSRFENRFQDYTYYALSCGNLTIDNEGRQRLPYFRAHSFWIGLTILCGLIGVFSAIYFSNELESNNKSIAHIENTIKELENELNLGQDIDPTLFSVREIPLFTPDDTYGNQVLTNKKPFEYYDVSIHRNSRPFLLMPQEYKMIMRVSLVTPRVLLGYKKPATRILNEYRNDIKAVIHKSTDITERIRNNALDALQSVNDTILERQMRSYGDRFRADITYVQQFFPTPFLYLPSDTYNTTRICADRPLFCRSLKDQQAIRGENMVIIHADHLADNVPLDFQIIHSQQLATLKEYRQKRSTLYHQNPTVYWTQGLGAISVFIILIALSIILSFLQANRQISRYYKTLV